VVVDLLVTGLGLGTGCEVHAGDRQTWQWHPKGHNGDRAWSACSVIPAKTFPAGRKWWRWFLKAAGAVRAASILLIHRGWPRPEVTAGRAPGTRKASSGCAAGHKTRALRRGGGLDGGPAAPQRRRRNPARWSQGGGRGAARRG
jgi:hypothetical protein